MKTKSGKAKGRRLMNRVREMLIKAFPLQQADVVTTPSGVPGPDLHLSPVALHFFPFSVEGKNQERLNIWESLRQAEGQNRDHTPLLVFSRNRSEIYCAMKFSDFLEVQRRAVL